MKKNYSTNIKWNVVNLRAKEKQIPRNYSQVLYVSREDGDKISVKYAEVIYGQGYANLYNNVGVYEVSVKTGLKWCYADELEIMEHT